MTWNELVKEYFPNATDAEIDGILWGHTSFPAFWRIGIDGDTAEACCRKQLQEFKSAVTKEQE